MEVARIAWYDWPSLSIDPAGHFTHASFTRANRRRRSKGTEFSGAKLKLQWLSRKIRKPLPEHAHLPAIPFNFIGF
jgi:hypothetical protein